MIYWKRKRLKPSFQLRLIVKYYNQSCNLLLFIMVICFPQSDKRNIKRANSYTLIDLCQIKEVAEAREKVDHKYNKINQIVDCKDFTEKWVHKEFPASQIQCQNK